MAAGISRIRLPLVLAAIIGMVASGGATLGTGKDLDPNSDADWLGVIAGDDAGSETELAAEMAELFASHPPFRVVPVPGDSGLKNISRLLNDPHIDAGFVSTDVLTDAKTQSSFANLSDKLQVVARLCPQEVHVLARADINSLADLAGKEVNFGPAGGSSAVTATILFRALNIEVEPVALDGRAAIEQLTQGAIAASVVVGAKPMPMVAGIPANQGLHLLPIAFGGGLDAIYLPTGFDHDDYPNLIEMETEIPSVATGLVLLAAASKDDPGHADRVAQLVDTLFSRFGELKKDGRHPKWREINLAASLPGWTRTPAAEAWLAQHPNEDARKGVQAKIEAGAAQSNLPVGQNQRDVLFKQYIEWQRAKGH
ncbi:TAXI family TRAP transporter solute-binding subunit [Methyloceanibacter sp.]|uniref:TAXI family TRAP transporter solute-binding subunit n=1 Tax=Methyloceanibacter sp. TaxID=1965321 RepID=UPI003D6C94E3